MSELRFFDCNTYIGRSRKPAPLSFHSKVELLDNLEYYGIEEAIVTHQEASDGHQELVQELADEARLTPCWVLPAHDDPVGPGGAELVAEMLKAGVRVARMFPPHRHSYALAPWIRGGAFDVLEAHRVPLLVSGSDLAKYPDENTQGFSAENIYDICKQYPRLPIIIVRFNYQNQRAIFPLLRECPNLYLEISYYTTHRGVEFIVQNVGAERLIFGTGMPINNPGLALTLVCYAQISEAEKRLIAGDNLRRLLEQAG